MLYGKFAGRKLYHIFTSPHRSLTIERDNAIGTVFPMFCDQIPPAWVYHCNRTEYTEDLPEGGKVCPRCLKAKLEAER